MSDRAVLNGAYCGQRGTTHPSGGRVHSLEYGDVIGSQPAGQVGQPGGGGAQVLERLGQQRPSVVGDRSRPDGFGTASRLVRRGVPAYTAAAPDLRAGQDP